MVARNRARYLAPIALAATITATYVIVQGALTASHSPAHAHVTRGHGKSSRFAHATFYIVQPGDNLTSIAVKTGVPLGTLKSLNPTIDPNSLQAAQRLRLRR